MFYKNFGRGFARSLTFVCGLSLAFPMLGLANPQGNSQVTPQPSAKGFASSSPAAIEQAGGASVLAQAKVAAAQAVLVVGRPLITYPGPTSENLSLERGQSVFQGAMLTTGNADQVNLRFADNTLVVVRPNSVLMIETWLFNESALSDTKARYRLEKGSARVVSGRGVEAARDKFRLNTPIAAIGVRGTDFTTTFDPAESATRVTVAKGEIIMSGFGSGCDASGFGPCIGQFAESLSEKDAGISLILKKGETLPTRQVVVTGPEAKAQTQSQQKLQAKSPSQESGPATPSSMASEPAADTEQLNSSRAAVVIKDSAMNPPPSSTPPPPVQAQKPRSLEWGRWFADVRPADQITSKREDARTKGGEVREVAIGNSDYILYRTAKSDSDPASLARIGPMDFKLTGGVAHLLNQSIETLTFGESALSVDVSRNLFTTSLQLFGTDGRQMDITARGEASSDGFFVANGAGGRVAGAVAHDGKNAAYLFEQQRRDGRISGVTEWERK
jgi:hypothetical protein